MIKDNDILNSTFFKAFLPIKSEKGLSIIKESGSDKYMKCCNTAQFANGMVKVRNVLNNLNLIDSSTISVALGLYRWAEFRKTKAGVKLHLRLKLINDSVYPDAAIITVAKKADKKQMDELVVDDPDILNVFDRAYIDYKKFDSYCEKSIRFVTRLKSNAIVETQEEYQVDQESPVDSDRKVILGTKYNKMEHPLRLIVTKDTVGHDIIILTNDFTLNCDEIAEIYRSRWKIELFFKWIKQYLRVKHFYG